MSRIVEIMGLPGSGKTTVSGRLRRELRERGTTALDRREAVLRCLRRRQDGWIKGLLKQFPVWFWEPLLGVQTAFLECVAFGSRHTELLSIVADWTVRSGWDEQKRHGILWAFAKLFAEAELIRRHTSDDTIVLLDEGFAHRGFSLFGYLPEAPGPMEVCTEYVDKIPLPDAVVWVDADVESCAHRLGKRANLPLLARGTAQEDLHSQLQAGRVVIERIASALTQKGIPVWRVDNSDGCQDEPWLRELVPKILRIPARPDV